MRHAETLARDTVLLYAPHFNSPDCYPTLEPPADTDKSEEEAKTWQEAASFLLGRGIADINNDGNKIIKMWQRRGGHCEIRAVCLDTIIEDSKTLISFFILVKLKAVECLSNLVQITLKVSAYV